MNLGVSWQVVWNYIQSSDEYINKKDKANKTSSGYIKGYLFKGPELSKVARSSKKPRIILLYPLADLIEYFFMFWLHRHLPSKQVENSKQSTKGYERIIGDISG